MKITYLGTAAAEAIPALFCECNMCEYARKVMGKELRSRSGIVINDTLLVDIPPDIYHSSLRAGIRLPDIKNIVVTHSHSDHCDMDELMNRDNRYFCIRKPENDYTVNVYGNHNVEQVFNHALIEIGGNIKGVDFSYIEPYKSFNIGDISITPLLASHKSGEECYIYLFEQSGKRFLYGNDTGLFPSETMDFLKGIYINTISLDCTFAIKDCEHGHMGIKANVKLKNLLISQGTADHKTVFIAHHFSHNGLCINEKFYSHEEFSNVISEYGFYPSYDTMKIEI